MMQVFKDDVLVVRYEHMMDKSRRISALQRMIEFIGYSASLSKPNSLLSQRDSVMCCHAGITFLPIVLNALFNWQSRLKSTGEFESLQIHSIL